MNYITEVVFSAIVCGILVRLAPSGKSGSQKFVKYAASLAFLCILVSPLAGELQAVPEMLEDLADIGGTADSADGYAFSGSYEVVSQAICKAAAEAAGEHFSVSAEDFSIRLILDKSDAGEYSIREATVYPKGAGAKIDPGTLEHYFSEILGCTAEVAVND